MLQPLDGPAAQGLLSSVGTSTPVEVKVGASALTDRKLVTLQGDGKFYVYFGDDSASAPSAADVENNGFLQFKDQVQSYEAGDRQPIYVLADSGTVDIRVAERA